MDVPNAEKRPYHWKKSDALPVTLVVSTFLLFIHLRKTLSASAKHPIRLY